MLVAGEAIGVGKKDDLILWKSATEVTKGNSHELSLHDMRSQTVLTWTYNEVITEVHGRQCAGDWAYFSRSQHRTSDKSKYSEAS
jgi:hypothetical protein